MVHRTKYIVRNVWCGGGVVVWWCGGVVVVVVCNVFIICQ